MLKLIFHRSCSSLILPFLSFRLLFAQASRNSSSPWHKLSFIYFILLGVVCTISLTLPFIHSHLLFAHILFLIFFQGKLYMSFARRSVGLSMLVLNRLDRKFLHEVRDSCIVFTLLNINRCLNLSTCDSVATNACLNCLESNHPYARH